MKYTTVHINKHEQIAAANKPKKISAAYQPNKHRHSDPGYQDRWTPALEVEKYVANHEETNMNRRKLIASASLIGVTPWMSGCNKIISWLDEKQDTQFEWTEDVPLNDGQTIVVKRSARLSANQIAGGGGGSFNKGMTMEIVSPTLPASAPMPTVWSDVYVPLLLDLDPTTQEWFIVATFFHCDSWKNLGEPPLPYTEYRFRQSKWQRRQLSPEFIGRAANLYIADRPPPQMHLTESGKQSEIKSRSGTGKKYLKIVDQWSTGC